MGLFESEAAPVLLASSCTNTALKWAIISGLVGLLGVTGVLVGLHLTGNLIPEAKDNSVKASSSFNNKFPVKTYNSGDNSLSTAVLGASDTVKEAVSDVADGVKHVFGDLKDAVSDAADVSDGVDDVFGEEVDDLADTLDGGLGDIIDGARDVADSVAGVVDDAGEELGESTDLDLSVLDDVVREDFEKAGDVFKKGVNNVVEAAGEAVEVIAERLDSLGDGVKDLRVGFGELVDGFSDLGDVDSGVGWMLLSSVLGSDFNKKRRLVVSPGANPYSAMAISRSPTSMSENLQQQVQDNLGMLLLALAGDGLDFGDGFDFGDGLEYGGEFDFEF